MIFQASSGLICLQAAICANITLPLCCSSAHTRFRQYVSSSLAFANHSVVRDVSDDTCRNTQTFGLTVFVNRTLSPDRSWSSFQRTKYMVAFNKCLPFFGLNQVPRKMSEVHRFSFCPFPCCCWAVPVLPVATSGPGTVRLFLAASRPIGAVLLPM